MCNICKDNCKINNVKDVDDILKCYNSKKIKNLPKELTEINNNLNYYNLNLMIVY